MKSYMKQFYIGSFQKRSILPPQRKFLPSGGGGEKKLFLIIVNVLGHPKGVGGLTSYFLRGGGMDVFWNDPFYLNIKSFHILCSKICKLLNSVYIKKFILKNMNERNTDIKPYEYIQKEHGNILQKHLSGTHFLYKLKIFILKLL